MKIHRRNFLRISTVLVLSLACFDVFSAKKMNPFAKKNKLDAKKRQQLFVDLSKQLTGVELLNQDLAISILEAHLKLFSRRAFDEILSKYAKMAQKNKEEFAKFYADKKANKLCKSILSHWYGGLSEKIQWTNSVRVHSFITNPTWSALHISAPGVPMGFSSWSHLST